MWNCLHFSNLLLVWVAFSYLRLGNNSVYRFIPREQVCQHSSFFGSCEVLNWTLCTEQSVMSVGAITTLCREGNSKSTHVYRQWSEIFAWLDQQLTVISISYVQSKAAMTPLSGWNFSSLSSVWFTHLSRLQWGQRFPLHCDHVTSLNHRSALWYCRGIKLPRSCFTATLTLGGE